MAKKKRKPRTPAPPRTQQGASARKVQAPQVRKKQVDAAVRERRMRIALYALGGSGFVGIVAALIVILALGGKSQASNSNLNVNWPALTGVSHGKAPWQAEINDLSQRLQVIGVPELPQEGTVLHIHQHLDIFVNGKHVTVPFGIGITPPPNGFFAELHTHLTDGIIHVESATKREFSLGEFFAVWGVYMTKKCIGGYCAKSGSPLKFYVNGTKYTGNPDTLPLRKHDEIAVVYGKRPKKIPRSFNFPPGY